MSLKIIIKNNNKHIYYMYTKKANNNLNLYHESKLITLIYIFNM
jgi:hypothetical protein